MTDLKYAAVVFALLAVATPLAAQRPVSSVYDTERQIRLEGAVTRIDWGVLGDSAGTGRRPSRC